MEARFLWQERVRGLCQGIGFILGALLILAPVTAFSTNAVTFSTFSLALVSIRSIVYGVLVILSELRLNFMLTNALFLTTHWGRSFFYLWIAADVQSSFWFQHASDVLLQIVYYLVVVFAVCASFTNLLLVFSVTHAPKQQPSPVAASKLQAAPDANAKPDLEADI
ncbi:TRP C-terminal domain-containing protein [Plasmodiophora brassicae]|nr:hypothetical protein PBRA_004167 [Plasmodiophora brassicae]